MLQILAASIFLAYTAVAQGVLSKAIDGYTAVCLATVPDFSGYQSAAARAGFEVERDYLVLPGAEARIEVFSTGQGCACATTLIAPDANGTAGKILSETVSKADAAHEHPNQRIAAVLEWNGGQNALQLESDNRNEIPLVTATLLSATPCPKR